MQLSGHEGIAHSHRVNNVVDIINTSVIHLAVAPQQGRQRVMARAHHVAHTHQPFVAAGETTMNLVKPFLIEIERHFIVGVRSLEGHLTVHDKLVLDDVAKHHVGILQHTAERLARIGPIFPKVLAVIDVERNRLPHLVGNLQGLKRSLTRVL